MSRLPFVIVLLLPSLACAQSWEERASRLNSTQVSAEDAAALAGTETQDKRNKICVRGIKPAMPGVDWNTDPTALPYMLYQINKRTDLPIYDGKPGLDVATDELFEHTVIYLTSPSGGYLTGQTLHVNGGLYMS